MKQIVYLNRAFLDFDKACISPNDRGFLFSDGVYEVIRSYNGYLFQIEAHLQRLQYGLREMSIRLIQTEELVDAAYRLLAANNLEKGEALIYIQVTRGVAPRTHYFPPNGTLPTIYMTASRFFHPVGEREHGVKIILVPDIRWSRCDIKTVGLIANVLARQQAVENGAAEAIFIRDGIVLEGTHCNFFAIFNGELTTAPLNNYILAGVTRKIVLEICSILKIPVKETPVYEHKLNEANEMMIAGTTVEITPVVKVNNWQMENCKPGPLTRKIQKAFREKFLSHI